MKQRFLAVLALITLITLVGLAAPVAAHDDDGVGRGGGTPGTSSNFRLVGANPLAGRGMNAALAVYGRYVYIGNRTDGFYSVHNTEVVRGDQAFSSWYSDGIVWWHIGSSGVTRLRGQFVPPAAPDPMGFFPTVPIVWGVYPDRDANLILASDINSGLWILKPVGLGDF